MVTSTTWPMTFDCFNDEIICASQMELRLHNDTKSLTLSLNVNICM